MRRKTSFIIILCFGFIASSSAQTPTSNVTKLDTVTSYVGILLKSGSDGYFVNEQTVSKRLHDYYLSKLDAAIRCKPCWVKNYNINEVLVSEGVFYGDSPAGRIIHYYQNGKIRTSGFYSPVDYSDLKNWYSEKAGKKDSTWLFFDFSGKLIKIEKYKNGVLTN